MSTLTALIVIVYFLPTFIANAWRHSPNGFWIFLLDLLTGWTLIGWIASFIWACVDPLKPIVQEPVVNKTLPEWEAWVNKNS